MKIHVVIICVLFSLSSLSQDIVDEPVVLEQIVLTAQYVPTHIDSSIYAVQIITEDELNSFASQNLSSVLNRQIGWGLLT